MVVMAILDAKRRFLPTDFGTTGKISNRVSYRVKSILQSYRIKH